MLGIPTHVGEATEMNAAYRASGAHRETPNPLTSRDTMPGPLSLHSCGHTHRAPTWGWVGQCGSQKWANWSPSVVGLRLR